MNASNAATVDLPPPTGVSDATATAPAMAESEQTIDLVPFTPSIELQDRFADLSAERINPLEQESLINLALDVLERRNARGEAITNPQETGRFFQVRLAEANNEVFAAVFLDNRHRVIVWETLFTGTIDGASVHPRVVAQRALEHNAAAIVFCHNHPSGVAEPSQADRQITQRIKEALSLVDVRVLDHIVVGASGTVSLAERGLL